MPKNAIGVASMEKSLKGLVIAGDFWLHKDERLRLLEMIDQHGSITKAAKAVGISYKTAWDSIKTMNNLADAPLVESMAGGKGGGGASLSTEGKRLIKHYRILQEEHRRFLSNLSVQIDDVDGLYTMIRRLNMKLSARNVFGGTVSKITKGAVNAEVTLALKGGTPLVAIVTNGAIDNLGLTVSTEACAIIKASSVIIGTDLHDAKVSARNIMCGTIIKLVEGPVSTEVNVDVGSGTTISAVITHESSIALGLKEGGHACALFKASSVILGVN
jgi:molybdate transport system regulatory protein